MATRTATQSVDTRRHRRNEAEYDRDAPIQMGCTKKPIATLSSPNLSSRAQVEGSSEKHACGVAILRQVLLRETANTESVQDRFIRFLHRPRSLVGRLLGMTIAV